MNEQQRRQLDADVAGCALAHQRLLAHLDRLAEDDRVSPSQSSSLADWTIGHVLTHLARNADAFRSMIDGAAVGEVRVMYRDAQAREADIELGARRSFHELVTDVRKATWALESAWAALDADGWAGFGLTRVGKIAVTDFPARRWREVEVHHSDLGIGFQPSEWSSDFVQSDLVRRFGEWKALGNKIPPEVANAEPWQQLAWLFGRTSGLATPSPDWF